MSDGLIKISKSTWNINALTKVERMRIHDALAQCSTKKEREAVLRHIFPYHIPTVEPMFSKLIKSVNDVFKKHRGCPPADYKHECYKELKLAMNEFQQFLKDERIISDSGEPVRFTLNRRSSSPSPRSTTSKPTTPSPVLYDDPKPLSIGPNTYMLNIPDFKLRLFATMILDRTTEEEKITFIKKYMVVKYESDDSDMPMPRDVETLDRVILTILSKLRGNASIQIKTQKLLDYLKQLKHFTQHPVSIYVLFPFPDPNPAALPIGQYTDMRNINDLKLRIFATMVSERNTDDEQKRRFIEKYVRVTDENGDPSNELLDDIIEDILGISNDDDLNTESKIKGIFEHLLHLKNTIYPDSIYVLYPFPAVYPDIFNRRRRIPTVRKLGGGGGGGGGMRQRNQRTKRARKLR